MRGSKGFRKLGTRGLGDVRLSAKRGAELEMHRLWLITLGSRLCQHARIRGIERGVLHIALDDPSWRSALDDRLPALMARLDRVAPSLRVRRWKVELNAPTQRRPESRRPSSSEPLGSSKERWQRVAKRLQDRNRY